MYAVPFAPATANPAPDGCRAKARPLAARVERHVITVTAVPFERHQMTAVGRRPELDQPVVAAARDRAAVGADRHRPDPAVVRLDFADRPRGVGVAGPPQELAVVVA